MALLNTYGRGRYVSLELGLQSLRNEALDFYERGHSAEEGIDAVKRSTNFPNLNVSVHLMFGAPGDTVETAIHAAKTLNQYKIAGVKIHQLMILKNTILADRYAQNPWPLLTMEEYNRMAMAFIEHLDPSIYIERTHGLSSHREELVGPSWSSFRFEPMNELRKIMMENNTFHGKRFEANLNLDAI